MEDQRYPSDYVGVNICKSTDGTYEFRQSNFIDFIIEEVGIEDQYTKPVPAKVSLHLHPFKSSPEFDLNLNYHSIVGKLNYLVQTTRPDIMYATHQIAKYSADPCKEHGEAIVYLVKYLQRTCNLGLRFKPNPRNSFDCCCDADFWGKWNKALAPTNPSTAKSRSGRIIFYPSCQLIWASKLQLQVALSTTEAE